MARLNSDDGQEAFGEVVRGGAEASTAKAKAMILQAMIQLFSPLSCVKIWCCVRRFCFQLMSAEVGEFWNGRKSA